MPKPKTAEADIVPADRAVTKPAAPAATHKRATKKIAKAPAPESPTVRAISTDEISRRAYSIWESRGRPEGSAEDDWFRAERELLEPAQNR